MDPAFETILGADFGAGFGADLEAPLVAAFATTFAAGFIAGFADGFADGFAAGLADFVTGLAACLAAGLPFAGSFFVATDFAKGGSLSRLAGPVGRACRATFALRAADGGRKRSSAAGMRQNLACEETG